MKYRKKSLKNKNKMCAKREKESASGRVGEKQQTTEKLAAQNKKENVDDDDKVRAQRELRCKSTKRVVDNKIEQWENLNFMNFLV